MTLSSTNSSPRWKAVAIGLAVLLIGVIAWDGTDRRAADATQPMSQDWVAFDKKMPQKTLKIASFNIHSGKGSDGVQNLSRTAELISDFDMVALYEVRATSSRPTGNQAASLGKLCNSAWAFAPTERQWWFDHFGNGLLHKIPIHSIVRIPLINTRGKAFRNAILSTATLETTEVRILSVHVDREADRRSQLGTVISLFLGLQKPCILMGDLNSTATDPMLIKLLDQTDVQSPLYDNVMTRAPSQNIDWIFTRGLKTISAKLVENTASDHPALQAEFEPID